jgi:hypothetical protein
LAIPVGTYYHHATSFHLYEENYEDVDRLISSSQPPIEGLFTDVIFPYDPEINWRRAQQRARSIFYGDPSMDPEFSLNDSEQLMWNAMRVRGVEGSW